MSILSWYWSLHDPVKEDLNDNTKPETAMETPFYEVIVGNVGTVYNGLDYTEALRLYRVYVDMSGEKYGRAAGESVTLMVDGEPDKEHIGEVDLGRDNCDHPDYHTRYTDEFENPIPVCIQCGDRLYL